MKLKIILLFIIGIQTIQHYLMNKLYTIVKKKILDGTYQSEKNIEVFL